MRPFPPYTVFGNFVSSQIDFCKEVENLKTGNRRLKEKTEAKDIELKLSRFVLY